LVSRGLDDFSPQGIGNTAWAFARQGQLAEDVVDRYDGATQIANVQGRLAVYTASFIDVGEGLLQRLFRNLAEADLRLHGTFRME
jgi:hypothetical protein